MEFFLLGAGYCARALARLMRGRAAFTGTTRNPHNFAALHAAGVEPVLFDGFSLDDALATRLQQATALLVSAPPGAGGDGLPELLGVRQWPRIEWIGYLSTTGVYGDHGGNWVDEDTPCAPMTGRSRARLDAERDWQRLGGEMGVSVAVLRLAGIYGPGRNALLQLERGAAARIVKPGHVFNRIHVEDVARAVEHLARDRLGGVFNLADDEPAPPQDVVAFAAGLMQIDAPPEVPFDAARLSPMQRSFYDANRRISNERIKGGGFRLLYETYRDGLQSLWSAGNWRSE